jgi:hypothetical protein
MSGSPKRETHLAEMARVSPSVSLDPPHRHFRSARHASVSAGTELAPAVDEDHASAGAKSARTALPHPWKAAVKLSLSSSMQGNARRCRRNGDWSAVAMREYHRRGTSRSSTQKFDVCVLEGRGRDAYGQRDPNPEDEP